MGGIVPHVTLKSIANNEPATEEVLVDRPEETNAITRVSGPFPVEATIPTPVDWEGDGIEDSGAKTASDYASFVDRMLEVLRRSPILHVSQAFFPRMSAWDALKRALKATFEDSVWDHLAGTVSAPFALGENKTVAIKVIDDRGNELLAIRKLERE